MTSFAVHTTMGTLSPIVSRDKGSMGNRLDCAAEQFVNNSTNLLKAGAVAGGAAGVTYAAAKSGKFANVVINGLKQVRTLMQKNKHTAKIANHITKALSHLPKAGKIGVIAAALAIPVVNYLGHKNSYEAGQIDQKYTDRANLQKTI